MSTVSKRKEIKDVLMSLKQLDVGLVFVFTCLCRVDLDEKE